MVMCDHNDHYYDGEQWPCPYSGPPLDVAGAEAILGPYPELWEHWKKEMLGPDPLADRGIGGVRRWHSPEYLNEVVSEYLWLQTGGDEVSPELEARCQEVAATYPGQAERRRKYLTDPWSRALPRLDAENRYNWKDRTTIEYYYDPEWMASEIKLWRESEDRTLELAGNQVTPSWLGGLSPILFSVIGMRRGSFIST